MRATRGTFVVATAFGLLATYAGCAKAPPPVRVAAPVAVAPPPKQNDVPWKEPDERVDVVGAPTIILDSELPNAAAPFAVRSEGFPAVSADGKTIAAIVDTGTIFPRPNLVLVDSQTGKPTKTIDFQGGTAAARWREGDAPEGFAKEVLAEAEAHVAEAHDLVVDFVPLPRRKLDVSSLYDELGRSTAQKAPFAVTQEASIDTYELALVDDRLTLRRDLTKVVDQKTTSWNRSSPGVPGKTLPCESKPVVSEIAVDASHGRAVVIVHHLNLTPGDICAEPEELQVLSWSARS